MTFKKVFDDGTRSIFTDDGENLEVDSNAVEIADLVLAKSDKLTKELVINLSSKQAEKMDGCAMLPEQELWIALALKLGFPGNYKAAAGRNFSEPAFNYIVEKTGMHVQYRKGYKVPSSIIQVVKKETL